MLDEMNLYTLFVATLKLAAIALILVMIAKNRNEVALDDPFFESQPWTLRDAYKVIVPPLLVIYVEVLLMCTVIKESTHKWLIITWLTLITYEIVALILYFHYIHKPYKLTWSTFGLDKAKFLISGVRHLNIAGTIAILILVGDLAYEKPSVAPSGIPGAGMTALRTGILGLVVMGVISCPIVEELLFRGLLYAPVARRLGSWKSMLLLALVFYLCHFLYGVHAIPNYVIIVLYYYGYTTSRSLWVPIIWHIFANFMHDMHDIAAVLEPLVDSVTVNRCYLYTLIIGLIIVNIWRHMYFRRTGLTREVLVTMKLQRHPQDSGVFIQAANPGSTAEKAGLRKGDVIVAYNGRRWLTTQRLAEHIIAAGSEKRRIHTVFTRDGIQHEVEVSAGALGVSTMNLH